MVEHLSSQIPAFPDIGLERGGGFAETRNVGAQIVDHKVGDQAWAASTA